MAHIFKEQFKIFKDASHKDLEKAINDFALNNKINSVDIKLHSFSQKGTMLCDRINPFSDTATIYIAIVSYQMDYTEKMVSEGLRQWATQKMKSEFAKRQSSPHWQFERYNYVCTGRDIYKEIAESIKNSPQYENVRKNLEQKYSEKD
jgi:hypothetical protein